MMISRTVTICNRRGLHARASAKFVTMASGLTVKVEVEKEGTAVVGTSIMGLMMLGAALGDVITIRAEGDGAEDAVTQLADLVEARFHEAE
jgi:phosphocarrier protein HPr